MLGNAFLTFGQRNTGCCGSIVQALTTAGRVFFQGRKWVRCHGCSRRKNRWRRQILAKRRRKYCGQQSLPGIFYTLPWVPEAILARAIEYLMFLLLLAALPLVDRPPADISRPWAGFVPREKPLVPRVHMGLYQKGLHPKVPVIRYTTTILLQHSHLYTWYCLKVNRIK